MSTLTQPQKYVAALPLQAQPDHVQTQPANALAQRYVPPPAPMGDHPPAARKNPPPIGLQLEAKALPAQPSRYDASIMHQVLPPTLYEMRVTVDASVVELASAFRIPVATVAAHWMTSRTPMELPGYDRRVGEDEGGEVRLRRVCKDEQVKQKELAKAVGERLREYVRDGVVEVEGDCGSGCGFAETHKDLDVTGRMIWKSGGGLYRCGKVGEGEFYTEVVIRNLEGEGGLVIGAGECGLETVVGEKDGVGFHAGGYVIVRGEWRKVCEAVGEGCVVGVMVRGGFCRIFVDGKEVCCEKVGKVGLVASLYRRGCRVELLCCERLWRFYRNEFDVRAVCGGGKTMEMLASSIDSSSGTETCVQRQSPR